MNNQLRKLWSAAGYSPKIGSAAVVPPPANEWRRVYHLTPAEYAISNIAFGRLKLARFADLNDPFELIAANLKDLPTKAFVTDFKESFDRENGLLCFSGDWMSPPMWAHYGSNHTGICFGFNLKRTHANDVKYVSERITLLPSSHSSGLIADDTTKAQLLFTKFEHWKYESEVRSLFCLRDAVAESGLYFIPFGGVIEVAEVILGARCRLSVDAVRGLVDKTLPGAVTFRARRAEKFFQMVPDENSVV